MIDLDLDEDFEKYKLPDYVRRPAARMIIDDYLYARIFHELMDYFKNDIDKIEEWFITENPFIGNFTPIELMRRNKSSKVFKLIINLKEGNMP